VTYAEGQRPGGINPPAPPVQCSADFANLGITSTPATYQHDTVKSTEVGGKFRLFGGRGQVNVSAFHIDWQNVQFIVSLPQCAFSYVANAATASSDGAELQATGRFMGFTVNGNLGYDNARYTATVKNLNGTVLANKGDNLGVPDWTANLGVQYDTQVASLPAYARMDYTYTGKYMRATGPGSSSYTSANGFVQNYINGNETHIMNARVGVYYKELEIAGYVKNLFDSREWINLEPGRRQLLLHRQHGAAAHHRRADELPLLGGGSYQSKRKEGGRFGVRLFPFNEGGRAPLAPCPTRWSGLYARLLRDPDA